MKAIALGLVALILAGVVVVVTGCSTYLPPQTGVPSRTNWLEGGGG